MPATHRVSGQVYAGSEQLEVTTCASCGVMFAAPQRMLDEKRRTGDSFYCPNGHGLSWHETEADKLRKRLDIARDQAARVAAERDQARASVRTQKGLATRFRNERDKERKRTTAGVCPVEGCKRHFENLERHIASQHPGFPED